MQDLLFSELTDEQKEHKEKLVKVLTQYVPSDAAAYCAELIMLHKLHLHIEVERKGRYGDYSPHEGKGNRISVNHNLSKYEFLITFVHELAHHVVYKSFGHQPEPHGMEWKSAFKDCMRPFLRSEIFPPDLKMVLTKHMQSPKYSQSADVQLLTVLKKYDPRRQHQMTLNDLQDGSIFVMKIQPNFPMKRLKKLRTYALCEGVNNNRQYKVHLMAEVQLVQK